MSSSSPPSGGAARKPRRSTLPAASISEFDGVRYLHLGRTPWVQGAMRLRKPRAIELEYVRRMMAWLLLMPPPEPGAEDERHVVQLGLGAAALTRYCHAELGLRTTAVELNPQVIAACRQWFRLPANDARLNVIEGDAGDWVRDAAQAASADVLSIDLYDQQAAAPVLDDADFYAACHAVLRPGGVLVANLFGRNTSFGRSARRIEAAFTGGAVRLIAPTEEGNTIVLALKGDWPDAATLDERARLVEARTGLDAPLWLRLLRPVPAAHARVAPGDSSGGAPGDASNGVSSGAPASRRRARSATENA